MSKNESFISKETIKSLNSKNSDIICKEIRDFLVQKTIKNGGHLASNLGVVELTLALHKVFDFPKDKVIFDVGHQCYTHKMLSGRLNDFDKLRNFDGISGFPKTSESDYDAFNTGHSSTSISAALGMANARDLKGDNYDVIAVIGDGALTGGMAFEALNDTGASKSKIIIILNDNEMSINPNVGGLSLHLSKLRLSTKYLNTKNRFSKLLKKLGIVGKGIIKFCRWVKNTIKFATIKNPLFESLGITYIGIIDGHNIDELTDALFKAKKSKESVIIHISTKKGKGYEPSEANPDIYHGIGAGFDLSLVNKSRTYTNAFDDYIVNKAKSNSDFTIITAAMASGCGLDRFKNEYPQRFYDVGIAEQHAVTFSAGMAKNGIVPVFCVYSTFLQRAYDQILHDVCIQNLHVVFSIDRAGVVGEDGETHQGVFDFSYLTHLPNMTILAPSCEEELKMMLDYAIDKCTGPVAVRYPKSKVSKRTCIQLDTPTCECVYNNGSDIVIISVGRMLECAIEVKDIISSINDNVTIINLRCIKPFDYKSVQKYCDNAKCIVTIEDNVVSGGAGQYISSCFPINLKNKIYNFGFGDTFIKQGKQDELFKYYKLTPEDIADKIKKEFLHYE